MAQENKLDAIRAPAIAINKCARALEDLEPIFFALSDKGCCSEQAAFLEACGPMGPDANASLARVARLYMDFQPLLRECEAQLDSITQHVVDKLGQKTTFSKRGGKEVHGRKKTKRKKRN